jgi:hypothetical protein
MTDEERRFTEPGKKMKRLGYVTLTVTVFTRTVPTSSDELRSTTSNVGVPVNPLLRRYWITRFSTSVLE